MPFQTLLLEILGGMLVTLVGSMAAILTTVSFLPQMVKAYRTKKMHDVSPYLMALYASGTTLWLTYGAFLNDWVIMLANAFGTAFNLILLYMKFAYGRSSSRLDEAR